MTVRITSKIVFTVTDTNHTNESFDVIGVAGLEKHLDECLGGFVDKMYSTACLGSVIRDKINIFNFLSTNKVDLQTIYELSDLIDEIKKSENNE